MSEATRPAVEKSGAAHDRARRPYGPLLAAALLVMLLLLATAGVKSYRDLSRARAHEADLREHIAEAQDSVRVLSERIERIKNDPQTLERLAREELGMVRDGDVVIVLPEEKAP